MPEDDAKKPEKGRLPRMIDRIGEFEDRKTEHLAKLADLSERIGAAERRNDSAELEKLVAELRVLQRNRSY